MSDHMLFMEYTWNISETGLYHSNLLERLFVEIRKLSRRVSLLTLAVFFCLSLADLLLTKILITQSGGAIYEANPLANLILTYLGWGGLTLFKFILVSLVCLIVIYVAYYRPVTARRLLRVACLITAGVVGYSLCLLVWFI